MPARRRARCGSTYGARRVRCDPRRSASVVSIGCVCSMSLGAQHARAVSTDRLERWSGMLAGETDGRAGGDLMGATLPLSVVLVHGAFVDGSGWRPVHDLLTPHAFSVSVVHRTDTALHA